MLILQALHYGALTQKAINPAHVELQQKIAAEFPNIGHRFTLPHTDPKQIFKTTQELNLQSWRNYEAIKKEALAGRKWFGNPGWVNNQLIESENLKKLLKENEVYKKPFAQGSMVKVLKQVFVPAALVGGGFYLANLFSDPKNKAQIADDSKALPPDSPTTGLDSPLPPVNVPSKSISTPTVPLQQQQEQNNIGIPIAQQKSVAQQQTTSNQNLAGSIPAVGVQQSKSQGQSGQSANFPAAPTV